MYRLFLALVSLRQADIATALHGVAPQGFTPTGVPADLANSVNVSMYRWVTSSHAAASHSWIEEYRLRYKEFRASRLEAA